GAGDRGPQDTQGARLDGGKPMIDSSRTASPATVTTELVPTDTIAVHGAIAEFDSAEALLEGLRRARAYGFTRFDAYTPYPVHGLDAAMGMKRSGLPWIVLAMGLAGGTFGFLLQWWTGAVNYPLIIGGKP